MAPNETKRHPSSRLFYFVAAVLGLSFSAILIYLAWSNVEQTEERNFAYDAIAVQIAVEGNIRTADIMITNLVSFATAMAPGAAAEEQFQTYANDSLRAYGYVTAMAYGSSNGSELSAIADFGDFDAARFNQLLKADEAQLRVFSDLKRMGSAVPLINAEARRMYLVQAGSAASPAAEQHLVGIVVIDLDRLVNQIAVEPGLGLALYTESAGVGGRQLIYRKSPREPAAGTVVKHLSEDNIVRLSGYSVRLQASKNLYWQDLNKQLIFVALFLGVGVSLLLIALARAKDLQARDLQARNRVIEERVLQQTRELAEARDAALEASRVKSDFLASMSHEIRTPLNAIIGMAELLGETRLNDEQEKYVGVFKNAGEALLSLVNDILDLSKIEADQLTLETIDFDLVDLVEQAAEIYALKADDRGIELVTSIAPGTPEQLVGDPGRIRQVVLNLIGNSIKFTDDGQIVVRVRLVEHTERVRLHFDIEDSGIGIPPDKVDSIFADFTQVDSSITRKYGGTGLGLSICKRLVELMSGHIWVESELGKGSVFQFEIELDASTAAVEETNQAVDYKRAVLIEPNREQAQVIEQQLRLLDVACAQLDRHSSLADHLDEMRQRNEVCDLVIVNGGDEGRTAIDLARALRNTNDQTPVVALFRPSTLAAGVAGIRDLSDVRYTVKPLKRAQFLAQLRPANSVTAASSAAAAPGDADVTNSAKILLVEDNPDNRMLVKAYLKKQPYEITEAENGEEAVAAFQSAEFDLVLMDVQMPVLDGYAATRAIRQWEADQGREPTTIFALTASAVKEDVTRSLEAGCDNHLTKPIKKKTLIDALQQVLP